MQEARKNNSKNILNKFKNKKLVIAAIIAIILLASCIITVIIPKAVKIISKALDDEYFEYEIEEDLGNGKYRILITVKDEAGIEYVKYPDGDILYAKDRTKLAIDYIVLEEVEYDFTVKAKEKEEVVHTVFIEALKIEGDYQLVNGVYLNKPDLSGFDSRYTRYLKSNNQSVMEPSYWISHEPDEDWYSYKEANWANIYYETNGVNTYYVWIPRYCFKLDQETQRSDVKFIDISNNYKDEQGNITTWEELEEQGYQIPEAFKFNGYRIPGYWMMKYTAGDVTTPSTINYDMSVYLGTITIRNITLNTSITNANPIVKYTVALNGEIIRTIESSEDVANIKQQVLELTEMIDGENVINITGLNAKGEIVGSMTKLYAPAEVNEPELDSFDKETTFYVTYDKNALEHSTIPITEPKPNNWYEYGESRWANIVTRQNGLEIYYTWIPRYEFYLDQTNQRSVVKFIKGTGTETTEGYQIPEAFTFNGVEITGYWMMKYTAGDEAAPRFDTELVATSNSIRTKGITGTAKADGQVYKYYINGEYKGESTVATDVFEYSGLQSDTKYTILVEVRDSSNNAYVGTIVKQIKTIEANKPVFGAIDESTGQWKGFNPDNTYYVLYDKDFNMTIGEKIKLDGTNIPENWYDYSQSRWANIVVTNGTVENGQITGGTETTYYTWIPRYEFYITSSQQAQPAQGRTDVRFIKGTSKETSQGYQIPEAFTFNGVELEGYWMMKYTAS